MVSLKGNENKRFCQADTLFGNRLLIIKCRAPCKKTDNLEKT